MRTVYIAETQKEFYNHAHDNNLNISDCYVVLTDQREKLMGLELSWDNIVVIRDPNMRFSFWQTLLSRIRIAAVDGGEA